MFSLEQMVLAAGIVLIGTAVVCLFVAGSSASRHEEKAYKKGCADGYSEGYLEGQHSVKAPGKIPEANARTSHETSYIKGWNACVEKMQQ